MDFNDEIHEITPRGNSVEDIPLTGLPRFHTISLSMDIFCYYGIAPKWGNSMKNHGISPNK